MNKCLLTKIIGVTLLIIAFVVFVLTWLIFKNPFGEYTAYLLFGFGTGLSKTKKKRIIFISFAIIVVIYAMIFDPIFKPQLDSLMNVNTVGNQTASIIVNGISLLFFFVGYYITRRIIIRKNILEEV